jgi:hypothetical protein
MILANRQTTKQHRRGKQERKQKRKQNRHTKKTNKWASKSSQLTRLYKIIWKTPNTEIPKRNFPLLSNPLVLFNRILRGYPLFFRRKTRLTI